MRTARDRYYSDPQFHSLVDHMTACIVNCDYTPSEMREAALLASINYESMYLSRTYIVNPELEGAFAVMRMYRDNDKKEESV